MVTRSKRSALEGLKAYYDRQARVCPECGYEDEAGNWTGETNGGVVAYQHECPSCRAVAERTITLSAA